MATIPDVKETGETGLNISMNWINEAHTAELKWPDCSPVYNRIWRSDPEVTIARNILAAWAGGVEVTAELPVAVLDEEDKPTTDDDDKARDYLATVLIDIEGGFLEWLKDCLGKAPFYGWGWWEVVLGLRKEGWKPPGKDPWRSNYDDGLVGIRRFATRRYSSFWGWNFNDNGTVSEFLQMNAKSQVKPIPIERSLHIIYGDLSSPEGVGTLEAIWRLERIKYALEVVQGIGYEHSAGHLSVSLEEGGDFDQEKIGKAARNILTAQPGNYAAWPQGVTGEFVDAPFGSAESILNAIRYYGILKLALLGMQFVAIATLTGSGSYAALTDASDIALNIFNNIIKGIVEQVNRQVVRRLFTYDTVARAFPNMTRFPEITVTEVKKPMDMGEFGTFISALNAVIGLGPEDYNAIRRETGFLPQVDPSKMQQQEKYKQMNPDDATETPEPDEEPKPKPQPQPQPNDES